MNKERGNTEILESNLRDMTRITDSIQSLKLGINENIRVLESVGRFYSTQLLTDLEDSRLGLAWSGSANDHINVLCASLSSVVGEMKEIVSHVCILDELSKNTEKLVSICMNPPLAIQVASSMC